MLLKKSRKQEIVRARHIAQYFLSMNTKMPVTKIAEFTGVDHSTIQHSVRKVEGYIQIYPQFNDTVFTIAFYIKWLNQLDMEITRHEITRRQNRKRQRVKEYRDERIAFTPGQQAEGGQER